MPRRRQKRNGLRRAGDMLAAMEHRLRAALLAIAALLPTAAAAGKLPAGFVYLRDIDPSIAQDMRYAGPDNFTGRPLPGYQAAECVLRREAAQALARVQADLARAKPRPESLRLLSPDPRRRRHGALGAASGKPRRADQALLPRARQTRAVCARLYRRPFGAFDRRRGRSHAHCAWHITDRSFPRPTYARFASFGALGVRRSAEREGGKREPRTTNSDFARGFWVPACAGTNGKSRGPCNGPAALRAPDNSLDMGTGFDCFDDKSRTRKPGDLGAAETPPRRPRRRHAPARLP